MLQWMGGARRKMNATKDSKLKRQREFFDHRKEKRRRTELGEEPGKLHTLADYIRQNLHGGESLDILGLRSLNPTTADVNTAANSDANLPDPATAALRPTSGDPGDVTVTTSNVSAASVGALKGDDQDTSSQQPECKTKSRRFIQEQKQEKDPYAQLKSGATDAAEREIKKLVNRKTELPLPVKGRIPVHVGNLQTKKVSSTRLNLSDMIISDIKGDSCGKKRSPSEFYAAFSQDGIDAVDKSIFDQGVQHPQQTFVTSDSVADWDDTKQLLTSSLQLKNSYDCHPETLVTGASDLLSKFLSAQKLKGSHQHGRQPQEHNMTGKDPLLETESLLNSFRVTHNEGHNLGFSNSTFNMTNGQVKKEPREINFSKEMFDTENFHVKQEPEEFDISDPFVTITSHHVKQEYQASRFSDPFNIIKNRQVKQGCQEHEYLSPGFNTGDHLVMQKYPFLPDLSYDQDAFKVDSNLFDKNKGSSSPENDPVTWDPDPRRNTSSTLSYFESEFPALDHFRSVQVPSCDGSPNDGFHQFATYDNITDMNDDFYPLLEKRGMADKKFDELRLPLDDFEVERQHTEAAFSSLDDYSPRRMKTNRCNFENETPDWDDVLRKKCTFSEQWNCEPSVAWNVPWRQENNDPAHSGGQNSGQTRNHNYDHYWSQPVAGGTTKQFTDYLTGDINVVQGKDLSSETQATCAPEILQDPESLFSPQINNGNEDFIIVCFRENDDSPNVDANTIHLPIQSIKIPLQLVGTVESSSGMEHDLNILSPETPVNRISQEIDDSRVSEKFVTAEATITTNSKLISEREDSVCDRILTSGHQARKDYLSLLNSLSSPRKDTEVLSWQVKEPHREASSEFQSPKTKRLSSNSLAVGGKIEDGLEHHSSNSDKADHCFSSNDLYDHCDDNAGRHEMTHNIEENSLEVCTPLTEIFQTGINGMSTTKAGGMLQKRQRAENTHDFGCRASFSSQEECSPAFQLNTVQAVLCKLQRPVYSCGSKQRKFSQHGIKNVDTDLLKLQKPTRPSDDELDHQGAERNQTLQKDIKQISDMNQKSDLESEIKPTAESDPRSPTHLNISGSRGSLPLSNADRCFMKRSASKIISRSLEEDEEKRGLSDVSKQRNKEARLTLDDIDAIASSSPRVSIQPYQRGNGSKTHSLRPDLQISKVPKSFVPAGDAIQDATPASERNQISDVSEEEQPSTRISNPPDRDAGKDCTPVSQRNPILVVHDKEISLLKDSNRPPPRTGVLHFPSNTLQVSERQNVIEASQEQQGLNDNQHNLPSTVNLQKDRGSTTTYDTAYVKMLESYVVQLKLENNVLRLSTAS